MFIFGGELRLNCGRGSGRTFEGPLGRIGIGIGTVSSLAI